MSTRLPNESHTALSHRKNTLQVLSVESSAANAGSVTRRLSATLLEKLQVLHKHITIEHRDVAKGLPFVNEDWIGANFTASEQRTSNR